VLAHAEDGVRYERAMTPDPALAGSHRSTATVILRGAALAYPHRRGPVLRGLDLELTPGQPVALTGPSGSGKTSVVLALLRFIDLSAGQLTVDATDALAMPPEQIRALIAWSPEQSALFPARFAPTCASARRMPRSSGLPSSSGYWGAVDPAVPGQGGDEAEQVRYPDLEDRVAGQVPDGQQREAGAVTGLVDRFGRPVGRALPAPNAALRTWLPKG
jgi:ABC-type Mn2+/Zn2+ transport system ATPase subunit